MFQATFVLGDIKMGRAKFACRHCSNYIFILNLTPGFMDWAKTTARWDKKQLSIVPKITGLTVCVIYKLIS